MVVSPAGKCVRLRADTGELRQRTRGSRHAPYLLVSIAPPIAGRRGSLESKMTAQELAKSAKRQAPSVRYAYNAKGNGVPAWDATQGRWAQVAGLLLTGRWCSLPVELLINGKHTHEQTDWTEVEFTEEGRRV